jgi:hypothetical protein
MSWYYAENNERRGPIEDAAFDSLVAAGSVRPETLVWREGMTNWQALSASGYRRLAAALPANMPPVPGGDGQEESVRRPGVEMGVCSESGRILPRNELVEIDGRLVSAEYKNVVLQRIREGVGSTGSSVDPEVLAQQIIARDYQLSAGSCISRGWGIMKANFWLCVGGTFLSMLVSQAAGMIPLVGPLFVFGPLTAGLYWLMVRLHRREPASLGDAFAGFTRNIWQLVGVGVIVIVAMLCCFAPAGICFGVAIASSSTDPSPAMMAIGVLLGVVGLLLMTYLGVCWVFSFALVIDKGIECWAAMKLSRRIVSMHWWQVFGVMFLTGLLIFGIMFGGMLIFGIIAGVAAAAHVGSGVTGAIVILFVVVLICLIFTMLPLNYATLAAAYEDIFGPREIR